MTDTIKWIPAFDENLDVVVQTGWVRTYSATYIPPDERYARDDMAFGKQGFWPKRREGTCGLLDRCGSAGEP